MEFDALFTDDNGHSVHMYVAGIIVAALAFLVAVRKGMAPGNVM